MKKNIDVTYDGIASTFGVEDTGTAILIIIKRPEAGTLRVMVNEVDAVGAPLLLQEWKSTWDLIGMKVRQELARRE